MDMKLGLVTLRTEHRLRVFENRVLRRIFGPKKDEVTGEWRKLHNELCDLYSSPSIIFFFYYENPSVFAICKNTFSKWKVGGRMAWRRVLSSAPLRIIK
jgi:hypothetical protein